MDSISAVFSITVFYQVVDAVVGCLSTCTNGVQAIRPKSEALGDSTTGLSDSSKRLPALALDGQQEPHGSGRMGSMILH